MIERGGAAEAAINGVNEAIDSMTNTAVVLVAEGFVDEKWLYNSDTLTISS